MAQVMLSIGGRRYELACREGEEQRLVALAAQVDAKIAEATQAVGATNEARQLLFAALLLADALQEAEGQLDEARAVVGEAEVRLRAAEAAALDEGRLRALETLAGRAEAIVARFAADEA